MDVNLTGTGPNEQIDAQVDLSWQALRTSVRPLDYTSPMGVIGGHYAIDAITGTIAANIAANSQIFQIRWADPTKFFILKKLAVQGATSTVFTTLFGADLELIIGHGSTANGSGGTPLAPTSISNRLRNTMSPTSFVTSGEIRVATTAALTAATGQTLEPAGIGYGKAAPFAANTTLPKFNLFEQRDSGTHPLILAAGDTLAVRTPNPGASGVWSVGFEMEWVEAVSY
jgi:hypothetical protein